MNCRACGGADLDTVFVMEPLPIAGRFTLTRTEAIEAPRYPLEWRRCRTCALVNTWPDIEPDWSDYSYRASTVPALRRHHKRFARWLADRFSPSLHIEIGGNDGVLTQYLPWPSLNIDPSDAWQGPGYNERFTLELAKRLPKADLVTSSNAFAHFGTIGDAFEGVRHVLRTGGVFVVEVHDLEATLRTSDWPTIYHEHAVEWDTAALSNVARLHGMRMVHVEPLPLHGGMLRAVFRPAPSLALPRGEPATLDFRRLQRAYDEAKPPRLPKGSMAYGAAARATVYLDHVRPDVVAVIDGSPRRQGRFVPGVGLPIIAPEAMGHPPAVLITAKGHEADIKRRHPEVKDWRET